LLLALLLTLGIFTTEGKIKKKIIIIITLELVAKKAGLQQTIIHT